MIPAEAIEAALNAWGGCPLGMSPKDQIARILKAAAPYLLAGAEDARADLYEIISHAFYNEHIDPSGHTADAIVEAGYRKVEP